MSNIINIYNKNLLLKDYISIYPLIRQKGVHPPTQAGMDKTGHLCRSHLPALAICYVKTTQQTLIIRILFFLLFYCICYKVPVLHIKLHNIKYCSSFLTHCDLTKQKVSIRAIKFIY